MERQSFRTRAAPADLKSIGLGAGFAAALFVMMALAQMMDR